jgi:hypothetical protein
VDSLPHLRIGKLAQSEPYLDQFGADRRTSFSAVY